VADTLQDSRSEAIRLIGEEQYRVWLLHLAGAALAFEENRMGVHQILMVRPDADGRSGLPRGRAVTLGADPALDRIAADVTQDEVDGAPRVHSGSDTMTGVAYPWGAFLTNLWVSAVVILVVMLGALGVAVLRKRHDGIDAVWGGGFAIVAITTLILSAGAGDAWRRWLITALTVVWGARLAWHIGRRNHGRPEDERYVALMARARATPTSARSVGSTCPRLRRCGSCPCRSSWASTGSRRPRPASSPRSSAWPCGWSGSSSRRSATRSSPGHRGPGQPGQGHGHGPVALHPPPQLLRRRGRLVGSRNPRAAPRRRADRPGRSRGDDVQPGQGNRREAAGEHHREPAARLHGVCAADQRLHSPAPKKQVRP
jgi:hypothetical protein